MVQIFSNLANVEDENTLTFQIKDTEVGYVNVLRRMILTGVESLAFNSKMNDKGTTTDVKISANTTPMTNEMLADRIGLIPIAVDMETWNPDTWDKDLYEFRLSMENDTNDTMPVKAEHIKVFKKGTAEEGYIPYAGGNKEFFHPDPVSGDTCLLAVLKPKQPNQAGQKIEFLAKASVGTGTQHIRWSSVSQCSYSYTIDTDEERQQEYFVKWLENNKKLSLEGLKDDSAKKEAMVREFQTMEVQRCYKKNEKGEPSSFDFVVESFGTMPISHIIEKAILNIEKKCFKYSGELPSDVRVVPADARMKGFDFYFPNEDHTLGNLLQTFMEANQMDTGEISFVGYKVPHPLRAEMVLRVGVDFERDRARDGKQTVARAAISKAAAQCALMFKQWREDWLQSSAGSIGMRNRESLRLNVGNAKALEQAVASVAAPVTRAAPGAKRQPQKSAFYGKFQEGREQSLQGAMTASNAAAATTPEYGATPPLYGATPPLYGATTPNYGAATTPNYGAATTPNYGAATTPNYSSRATTNALPEGWEEKVDNEGKRYYSALQGRLIQYTRPTEAASSSKSPNYAPF